MKLPDLNHRTSRKPCSIEKLVEIKMEDYDVKGAIRIISSNDTLTDVNRENFLKLKATHPSPSRPLDMPEPMRIRLCDI